MPSSHERRFGARLPRGSFRTGWPLALLVLLVVCSGIVHGGEGLDAMSIDIDDSGYRRNFEVAHDELYVEWTAKEKQLIRFPEAMSVANIQGQAFEMQQWTGANAELVLYEKNVSRTESTRRILTKEILVRLAAGIDPALIARQTGVSIVRSLDYAPGWLIFEANAPGDALRLALALRKLDGVAAAEPLLGRKWAKKVLPNDLYFPTQWFLLNTGQSRGKPGIDLNTSGAWERFRGRGVTIAIVDDGIALTHPDLAQNVVTKLHHDYRDNDTDPSPGGNDDYHGTAVAGVAAARGNNSIGTTGVAYEATLVGVRLVGGPVQTDSQSAAGLMHSNQVVQVSNSSWGAEDDGKRLEGLGTLARLARENAARNGRGGKGTIFVWSGGNGRESQDDVNYDGYANSRYVISVAAINDLGRQAAYSEPGACLTVTAPSNVGESSVQEGIATTDLLGDDGLNYLPVGDDLPDPSYTQYFGGTSAAAAMVSGLVALVLEANPNLGWRDVKEILLRSATQVDPLDSDWVANGAGFHFNHKFGAGLANASAAVTWATNWVNLGPQASRSLQWTNLSRSIPDNDPTGVTFTFDLRTATALRVEHAVLTATILHPRRGDLAMTLVSPQGTRSRLAERHADPNADYPTWEFTSVIHWGEASQGEWKLHISDLRALSVGTVKAVHLELFGVDLPDQTRPFLEAFPAGGGTFRLRMTGVRGGRYDIQASADVMNWATILRTNLTTDTTIEFDDTGSAGFSNRFYRAVRLPSPQ